MRSGIDRIRRCRRRGPGFEASSCSSASGLPATRLSTRLALHAALMKVPSRADVDYAGRRLATAPGSAAGGQMADRSRRAAVDSWDKGALWLVEGPLSPGKQHSNKHVPRVGSAMCAGLKAAPAVAAGSLNTARLVAGVVSRARAVAHRRWGQVGWEQFTQRGQQDLRLAVANDALRKLERLTSCRPRCGPCSRTCRSRHRWRWATQVSDGHTTGGSKRSQKHANWRLGSAQLATCCHSPCIGLVGGYGHAPTAA